eukprot:1858667-Karenia_brevis.AAC.1
MGFHSITEKVSEKLEKATEHLEMCCQMYHGQVGDKKYFLHEHPHTARSWEKACVQGVLARSGVYW